MQQQVDTTKYPIWDIRLEVLKDFMFVRKGQTIDEIIQAEDKDKALEQALRNNDMATEQLDIEVKCLGIRLYTDDEQTI